MRERTKDEREATKNAFALTCILFIVLLAFMLAGCASYTIRDSCGNVISQGSATGFLRTITVIEKYDKDGLVTERKISTDSTTKEILMGLDKLLDSGINTASKIKP